MIGTIEEIAKAIDAKIINAGQEQTVITGVEFDSRKIEQGYLFVALNGARDGHDFVQVAKDSGAVCALVSKVVEVPSDFTLLLVEDVLVSFQALAKMYLQKLDATVIAVTGSNGKTSTKDMIAQVCAQKFATYKTQGNYNNEIGLPYTILHTPQNTEKLVLEMGMDHAGDIHLLSTLATPDIAVITLIGESHLEFFGSRANIAKGKMEIVDGLKTDGTLIVPFGEPLLTDSLKNISQKTITFGLDANAPLHAEILKEEKTRTTFKTNFFEKEFEIPVSGSYNVKNALVAAYIGKMIGLTEEEVFTALQNVSLTRNRTEWKKAKNGAEILSDVYNANPTAMKLVLESFSKMPVQETGKRIAVLGDMLELGKDSQKLHESIAASLNPNEISHVFLYGQEMKALAKLLADKYEPVTLHWYAKEDKAQLMQEVRECLAPADSIVLKASNGMGLFEVVEGLV